MIGYWQARREARECYEDGPTFREWLGGRYYRIRARLVHGLGGHVWRWREPAQPFDPGSKRHRYCDWCGARR
jgi:hypothetical protein